MPQENLKSGQITNLDASPVTRMAPGEGGHGTMRIRDASISPTTGLLSTSTYRLSRLRYDEILKHAYIKGDSTSNTFTVNVGFYYSDSTTDGTQPANQGAVISTTFVTSSLNLASQTTFLDLCQYISAANLDKPLWSMLGLNATTGGYIDLVLYNTTTNSTTTTYYCEVHTMSPGAAS